MTLFVAGLRRVVWSGVALGAVSYFATVGVQAQSAGALGNGESAAAVGRGGEMAAELGPLDAVEGNPAGLAGVQGRVAELDGVGLLAGGQFQNSVDSNGKLTGVGGALPMLALASQIGGSRWKAAVAVTPDLLMRADWKYFDPPGTAGVTYGEQKNESKIVALRSSGSVAWSVSPQWSVGASLGVVYNANTLDAPYIFQQQAALAGLKVLLDLNTSGYGVNGSSGAQWQPTSKLRLGAAWKSGTYIASHGSASGSASALFAALGITSSPLYSYAAEVDNHLPQAVAGGVSYEGAHKVRYVAEGDWANWGKSFRALPVILTGGTNAVINSVVGASAFRDVVPLHWHDQGAIHAGVEVPVAKSAVVRAGYAYMSAPVPSTTLTPLTAAILQNSIGAGVGVVRGKWVYDVAYQAQLPASQSVGTSGLLAGEYSNSHVRVFTNSLTVGVRGKF